MRAEIERKKIMERELQLHLLSALYFWMCRYNSKSWPPAEWHSLWFSASVYTWVKLPKHLENYPADSPESFLLPLCSNSLLSIHFHAVMPHRGLKTLLADKARARVCLYMYYMCIHTHRGMCYLTLESWTPSWKTEPFLIYVSFKQG